MYNETSAYGHRTSKVTSLSPQWVSSENNMTLVPVIGSPLHPRSLP